MPLRRRGDSNTEAILFDGDGAHLQLVTVMPVHLETGGYAELGLDFGKKPAEAKPVEPPVEVKPVEVKPVETKPVEAAANQAPTLRAKDSSSSNATAGVINARDDDDFAPVTVRVAEPAREPPRSTTGPLPPVKVEEVEDPDEDEDEDDAPEPVASRPVSAPIVRDERKSTWVPSTSSSRTGSARSSVTNRRDAGSVKVASSTGTPTDR